MDLTATRQTWEVRSMSDRDRLYIVRQNQSGAWSCSCPHWQYRLAPIGGHCKHIEQLLQEGAVPPAQVLQILAQLVDAQRTP